MTMVPGRSRWRGGATLLFFLSESRLPSLGVQVKVHGSLVGLGHRFEISGINRNTSSVSWPGKRVIE